MAVAAGQEHRAGIIDEGRELDRVEPEIRRQRQDRRVRVLDVRVAHGPPMHFDGGLAGRPVGDQRDAAAAPGRDPRPLAGGAVDA